MSRIKAKFPGTCRKCGKKINVGDQIEWQKGLGYLGSLYCNERSWKLLRVGAKKDRNKAEE